MKMFVVAVVLVGAVVSPALAYENFIPLGTGYSADVDSLPGLESDVSGAISKADVYETELYFKARKAAEDESYFRRFQSNTEFDGGDSSLDY